eukprot:TRINITY_DN9860_c0_g1_i2.p1 TRINITY_DN9860_c0_g1~~TRINITY_DN9860_c0_g1_i2.p1  ORF type:complete len:599 (-),score=111.32 TRINITY_DN9860_c0_g1_i2:66-1862(-)
MDAQGDDESSPLTKVSFRLTCNDTRMGQHVRVVGSCAKLGNWSPSEGLLLHTSALEFPIWHSAESVGGVVLNNTSDPLNLPKDEVIEYKYVICGKDGKKPKWEERPNRVLHIADLLKRGVLSRNQCYVTEAFNALDVDGQRFSSGLMKRTSSSKIGRSKLEETGGLAPTRRRSLQNGAMPSVSSLDAMAPQSPQGSMADVQAVAQAHQLAQEPQQQHENASLKEQEEPRERPSVSLLPAATGDVQAFGEDIQRSQSASRLPETIDAEAIPPASSPDAATSSMVREESWSGLFLGEEYEEEPDLQEQEFEEKYQLLGEGPLGEGTFGLVWRCRQKSVVVEDDGEKYERAAKIVRKQRLHPRDLVYLLGEDGEVKTHMGLKHTNIVELYEVFDELKQVTLVLEYCRGGDLFDAITRKKKSDGRPLTEKQAAVVTQHLLHALEYLHARQIVHRDMKCENVLLWRVGVPLEQNTFKLCDFGFAAHDRGQGLCDRLGSPDTVAPEVLDQTGRYGVAVDIWSLGVLVYMMLAARPPFFGQTDADVLSKVKVGSFNMAGPLWETISSHPKEFLKSTINISQRSRPTASQALQHDWLRRELAVSPA